MMDPEEVEPARRVVDGASALWGEIVRQGMLDLDPRTSRGAYDRGFEQAVCMALFGDELKEGDTLAIRLELSLTRPERLLNAVMAAAEPFSHMLRDIMAMLVEAKAPTAAQDIDIEFNFDEADPALRATFEEFRVVAERWEAVAIRSRELSADWAWQLAGGVLGYEMATVAGSPLASWFTSESFDPPPMLPSSGQLEFDEAAAEVRDVVSAFLRYCRSKYPDRRAIPSPIPDHLLRAAHDYWHHTVMGRLVNIATEIASLPALEAREAALTWAAAIRKQLDLLPVKIGMQQQRIEELLDLLRLPLWGKRAEMYAVWVAARLTKALAGHVEFYAPDGYLHFGFRETRIARIQFQGHELEYWTELRTPFTPLGESKRKKGVQPDHRIIRAGGPDVPDTVLCLECKHYAASSVSNFAGAANDYAAACPDALVQLVNHGPILSSVRNAIKPEVTERVELQGMFRAGDMSAIADFDRTVLEGLKRRCPKRFNAPDGHIEVSWNAPLIDVDVHIRIAGAHEEEIWFRNPGRLDAPPFIALQQDVQTAPGRERVTISKWIPTTEYSIWVHDFSGTGNGLLVGGVELTIVAGSERLILTPSPTIYSARAWHAADIYPDTARINKVDDLVTTFEPWPLRESL